MDLFSEELDDPTLEPTYTVSQLGEEVRDLLREAYASVWVVGELQRLVERRNGHRYFELVEKGEGDAIVGKLDAVVWRRDFTRVAASLASHGLALTEGVAIRCRVAVDFYPPHGRLQVHVKEVDPYFTAGELARRREATLAELERAGLLDANRELPLPDLPLRVALVTAGGSAAYHDFVATLAESGFGFRVAFLPVAVQGAAAERDVPAALRRAAGLDVDCVALVRGGGAKSDLAAFDGREVAFAVARCPLPVLAGLGHEIDSSVADRVAHQSFKTPTKVAEALVDRLEGAELAVDRLGERLAQAGRLVLRSARARLAEAELRARSARSRLERAAARLAVLPARLAAAARTALRTARRRRSEAIRRLAAATPRLVARERTRLRSTGRELVLATRGRLAAERAALDGRARLVAGLAPEKALRRGFSITRLASGELVRDPATAPSGSRIVTTLARGTLTSRVEDE